MRKTQTLEFWTTEAEHCRALIEDGGPRLRDFNNDPGRLKDYLTMQERHADADGQPGCAAIIRSAHFLFNIEIACGDYKVERDVARAERDAARAVCVRIAKYWRTQTASEPLGDIVEAALKVTK